MYVVYMHNKCIISAIKITIAGERLIDWLMGRKKGRKDPRNCGNTIVNAAIRLMIPEETNGER